MAARSESAIAELIAPVVESRGLDLEKVELRPAGRRSVLVVIVDADGGVDLETVAEVSRELSEVLDESPLMGESPYTLEVSSPGVDRPLALPRHWRRNVGRLVRITLVDGTTVDGRIVASGEDGATIALIAGRSGKPGKASKPVEREVAYADVQRAVVQVEFGEKKEN